MAFNESLFRREFHRLLKDLHTMRDRVVELEGAEKKTIEDATAQVVAGVGAQLAEKDRRIAEFQSRHAELHDQIATALAEARNSDATLRAVQRELDRSKRESAATIAALDQKLTSAQARADALEPALAELRAQNQGLRELARKQAALLRKPVPEPVPVPAADATPLERPAPRRQ